MSILPLAYGPHKSISTSMKAHPLETDAYEITNLISTVETPEEFDDILSRYPGFNLKSGGRCCWTVLSTAMSMNKGSLVDRILDLDPSLIHKGFKDPSIPPLYCAVENRHLGFVKKMTARGADVNLCGQYMRVTPLQEAIDTECLEIAKFLIQRGGVIYRDGLSAREIGSYERILAKVCNEIVAVKLMKNAQLHSDRSISCISLLPVTIRWNIAQFLEENSRAPKELMKKAKTSPVLYHVWSF